MKRIVSVAVTAVLAGTVLGGVALAQDRPWHNPDLDYGRPAGPQPGARASRPAYRPQPPAPRPDYHPGRESHYGVPPGRVHHSHRRPPSHAQWERGHWHHGRHRGREGWWWIVGGTWFYFAQPAYPVPPYVYAPPTQPSPPVTSYYYCYNPPGYYPNVRFCPGGWYSVPATGY